MSESILNRSPQHRATPVMSTKVNYVCSVSSNTTDEDSTKIFCSLPCAHDSRYLSGARKHPYMIIIIEMEVIRINNINAATSSEPEKCRSMYVLVPVCIIQWLRPGKRACPCLRLDAWLHICLYSQG